MKENINMLNMISGKTLENSLWAVHKIWDGYGFKRLSHRRMQYSGKSLKNRDISLHIACRNTVSAY